MLDFIRNIQEQQDKIFIVKQVKYLIDAKKDKREDVLLKKESLVRVNLLLNLIKLRDDGVKLLVDFKELTVHLDPKVVNSRFQSLNVTKVIILVDVKGLKEL